MPTYTINITSKTMAQKDTVQDGDRVHDADGYNWTVTDYGTYSVSSQKSTIGDIAYSFSVAGIADPALEIRGNGEVRTFGNVRNFSLNGIQATKVSNTYFPFNNIEITPQGVHSSGFGIRLLAEITSAARVALTPALNAGLSVRDSDTGTVWHCNGVIWFPLGKLEEFTTAQRVALNVLNYKSITVHDTDTDSAWFCNGVDWIEQ